MGKRFFNNKSVTGYSGSALPIAKGGTAATNSDEASITLDAIDLDRRNAPDGAAGLDLNVKVPVELFPPELREVAVSIDGPLQVIVNSSNTYQITRYSSFNQYAVSASAGAISRVNETITFVAPATPQVVNITINNRIFAVDVVPVSAYVNTPVISAPVNNAVNQGPGLSISASVFNVTGTADTHESTDWQIATDANFTNIAFSSIADATNKTSWSVSNLLANTNYFIRVRYKGSSLGYGNWSNTISFTTKTNYLPTNQVGILKATTEINNGMFGKTISLDNTGDRAVIGNYTYGSTGSSYAYVFKRTNNVWNIEERISAQNSIVSSQFGYSVSMSGGGDRIVVGAPGQNTVGGVAAGGAFYVFTRSGTTWTQEAEVSDAFAEASARFGNCVAIDTSGSRIITTAPNASSSGVSSCGKMYSFTRSGSTWTQEAVLTTGDKAAGDELGISLAMSDDAGRVVVGAATNAGSAYIFSRSGSSWTQEARLYPTAEVVGNQFGWAVSMDTTGTRVVVSEPYADISGITDAGKAYIYTRSGATWTQEAIVNSSVRSTNERFGAAVCLSNNGDRLYVVKGDTSYSNNIEVFTRAGTTWSQSASLTYGNGSYVFGADALALSGNDLVLMAGDGYAEAPGYTIAHNEGCVVVYI